ncbi:MAG TPA: M36 family metallopeptidase, partial [Prosthecobacter sp.]
MRRPFRFPLWIAPLAVLLLTVGLLFWKPVSPEQPRVDSPSEAGRKTDKADKPVPASLSASPAPTAENPRGTPLPDFDVRAVGKGTGAGQIKPSKLQAVKGLQQLVPGVRVDFDPVTGSPKWIGSTQGLLTGRQQELAAADADAPIRRFIEANRDLFGHGPEVLDSARRVTDYTTSRSQTRKAVWHQQLDGIDIFEAVFQANLSAKSELVNVGSHLVADPEAAAAGTDRKALAAAPPVPAEAAVAAAGQSVGEKMTAESVRATSAPAPQPDRQQQFRAALLTDADARLVWVPMNESRVQLAWDVTLTSRSRGEMYRVLVDAQTGGVLVRQALTAYISPATYRVFTTESPTPFSPGHETPSSLQPLPVERQVFSLTALNLTASPEGWIPDGTTITTGNNADAYTDADNNNVADLPRTDGTAARNFDFPLNLANEPATQKEASVTQLFYWTNFAHDRLYELGFTEAAGNFQLNNFGRGGLANDPVNAEAQDGSGTNNANFSTPVDGGRGRMQMFNWTGPTPDRDGSFEAEVVLHEYCHGLSNRLVGGPSVTISALASRGMGEGWSDFYGQALTAEASDNPHGNWARAGYSRYQSSGWFSENYYYGARRYSYSTDMLKNPHTFRDIDPNLVDWHTAVPRNPLFAATQDASQVHYVGTIWCTMLWDMRANLILKHGFQTGNERAMFLVAEGMKLGPANPNLVQARDGILQATMVNHVQDMGEVWTAFAKRGLGDGAAAPASSTTTGVTESYKVPDALEIDDRSGWNIHGSLGGSFAPAARVLTLTNDGSTNLNWAVNAGAGWLVANPSAGQLAPGAQVQVALSTQAGTVASGFHSTNVVFENLVTGFKQPVGVRLYVKPPVVYDFPLDSQPGGWTTTGEWGYGIPMGGAGTVGNPDPVSGATGGKVFGTNLAGAHSTAVSGPFYLTTAPLNLQARKNTRLSFRRWLNTASLTGTRVTVEVATNGNNWREVYVNPSPAVTDNAWQTLEYDISSMADRQPTVQVRWSYQVLSGTAAYTGWNLDDIQVLGEPTVNAALAFATDTVPENGAPVTATVSLSVPLPQPLEVNLSSSAPSVASVPASVTLAAGQLSQTFSITPHDNALLDGTRSVTVSASAPGLAGADKALQVTDDELAVLTLSAAPALDEGQQSATAALSVSQAPDRDVVVEIVSSDPVLNAPAAVTLPAGSSAPVIFPLTVADDAFATGNKSVTLTARVAGWTNHPVSITIRDDESPTLVLTGPASVAEGEGPQICTVTANTLHTSPVQVTLSSSDVTEGTVPASVTLPAGVAEVSFLLQVVDDADLDGPRPVTLTAAAAGYASAIRQLAVQDNDVSSYRFATIASPQWRNQPVTVTVTAHDVAGNLITNHTGSVSLTSTSSSGPVPFTPAVISGFSGGAASMGLLFTEVAQNIVLTATDGNGKTGSSNAFAIQPVVHHSFAWSGLPLSIRVDEAFTANVRAVDDQGTTATGYQDNTLVEAWMGAYEGTVGSTGSATTTTAVFNTAVHESRTQLLYTAAELGTRERWLGAFNFSSVAVTTQPLLNFTMRVKHTDKTSFEGGGWEDGGWTTIYSGSLSTGQTYLPFVKPFLYDGAQNLIVDISFDNASTSAPAVFRTVETAGRVQSATANGNSSGPPLSWNATSGPQPAVSNQLPVLLLYEAISFGPVPSSPAVFTSGQATVKAYAPMSSNSTLWLLARAPSGVEGFSNRVTVSGAPAGNIGTALVFSDSFESGTLSSAWTATKSGATARTLVTSANLPKTGSYHLTMDTTSTATGTFARNSPTLTLDLTGRKNVSVEWMAKKFLDENHAAPLTGPDETLPDTANYDGVAISRDGITWVEVSSLTLAPASYGIAGTRVFLDPVMQKLGWTYNSTFRIRFSQYDDQAIPNDGIAIDDVSVRAEGTNVVSLTVPPNIAEGASLVQATASVAVAPAAAIVVSLSSSAPAILEVPSAVMIPAGQTSASFTLNAPQNQYADLGKPVIITATVSGYTTSYTHTRVLDDERPQISVTVPPVLAEGGSGGQGTASFSQRPVGSFRAFFSSSDTTEATVSAYVTVPQGGAPSFVVTPVNDTLLDGDQTVEVTARVAGMTDGKASLVVADNESRQLVVSLPAAEMREGTVPVSGTVTLSGTRSVETLVTLASSHPGRLKVPLTTLIPAGSLSASFLVQAVDDDELMEAQEVLLTLKAEGLLDGQAVLRVVDNEPHALEISALDPQLTRYASYPLTIRAVDDNGDVVPYNGTVTLAARAGETPLALSSGPSAAFVSGVWTGSFAVGGTAAEARLTAASSSGATGTSEVFSVQPGGEAERLVFAPVASPQNADTAVTFQVHAADAAGVRVAGGVGPVVVELVSSGGQVLAQTQVTLVEGMASGSVTAGGEIGGVRLKAAGLGLAGESAAFDIAGRRAFPEMARLTLFEDGFEAAAFKPEWQITGTGPHRTQVTGYGSPRGLQHMVMDAAGSPAAFARNEATLTLDLAGMEEVSLKFWMKEFADEDHSVTFPVTNGGNFDGVAISVDGVKWYEVQGLRT